ADGRGDASQRLVPGLVPPGGRLPALADPRDQQPVGAVHDLARRATPDAEEAPAVRVVTIPPDGDHPVVLDLDHHAAVGRVAVHRAHGPGLSRHGTILRVMRPAEVIVVGGGVVGLCTACELARRGLRRVAVLERGACGQGATAKATGGIRVQFGSEVNVRLSLRSLEAFRHWPDRYGGDAGYRPVGYVFLATGAEQMARLSEGAELQRRLGARVERWSPADAGERLPGVRLDGVSGATFGPDDGLGDPGTAVNALL